MKIASKGQVIPLGKRKHYGQLPKMHVEIIGNSQTSKVVRFKQASGKGRRLIERMTGKGNGKLTTAQIMKLMRG